MALIKCIECGKQFSDKAAACPNCGCPTSEMQKTMNKTEVNASKAKKSKEADAAISAAVKKTRREADAADRAFDSASFDIQMKASRDIDLFGGDAPHRIVEIRADAKRACDNLYTTYQTLIPVLDATCRPLLADTPSREAVKSVADCIKYLNDESEIENNYNLTFNSDNLGNVASAKYVPSMENKMIQKFWESQVSFAPTTAEITKRFETPEERTLRLKVEEERKKADEVRRKEEEKEKEKIESVRRKYNQDIKSWETECSQIDSKRTAFVTEKLAEEKERIVSTAAKKKDEAIAKANQTIKEETERKTSAETALASLGLFKISEKKEKKWTIEYATRKISEAQASISAAQSTYALEIQQADEKTKSKESVFQSEAERLYPLPTKPSKPTYLIEADKRLREENRAKRRTSSAKLTAQQSRNEVIKAEILEFMEDNPEPMTVSDMIENIPVLEGEGNQYVSALLRQLVLSGDIEKFSEKRRTYFRIPE